MRFTLWRLGSPAWRSVRKNEMAAVAEEERIQVQRQRYREALEAGLKPAEAHAFAKSQIDIGQLRQLVAASCKPALIARILL